MFEIRKAKDGRIYFVLKAKNGEIVLTSKMFKTTTEVQEGIKEARRVSRIDKNYERKSTKDFTQRYFLMLDEKGSFLGESEMYEGRSGRSKGINCIKKIAQTAKVMFQELSEEEE